MKAIYLTCFVGVFILLTHLATLTSARTFVDSYETPGDKLLVEKDPRKKVVKAFGFNNVKVARRYKRTAEDLSVGDFSYTQDELDTFIKSDKFRDAVDTLRNAELDRKLERQKSLEIFQDKYMKVMLGKI